jgi:hypothetical protein
MSGARTNQRSDGKPVLIRALPLSSWPIKFRLLRKGSGFSISPPSPATCDDVAGPVKGKEVNSFPKNSKKGNLPARPRPLEIPQVLFPGWPKFARNWDWWRQLAFSFQRRRAAGLTTPPSARRKVSFPNRFPRLPSFPLGSPH